VDWTRIEYFKPSEFDSPDEPGSGQKMEEMFVKRLDYIRDELGTPLRINSGYRTEAHNKSVGGKPGSAHTLGLAADLRCEHSTVRFKLVKLALLVDFTRIGIGKTFIHLDDDRSKPQQVMWLY